MQPGNTCVGLETSKESLLFYLLKSDLTFCFYRLYRLQYRFAVSYHSKAHSKAPLKTIQWPHCCLKDQLGEAWYEEEKLHVNSTH